MAISVYGISAPTNLQSALQNGGSLAADTTYYWTVIVRNCGYNPQAIYRAVASVPSAEGSFTTTTTQKSVIVSWDAVTPPSGSAKYDVYISTTSGVYTYRQATDSTSMSSTTNSLTITALSLQNPHDTFVIKNNPVYTNSQYPAEKLIGGIDPSTGIVFVEISDNVGTIDLWDIKDACDSAGFSDYCSYDGNVFVLKGSIYAGTSAIGSLTEYMKNISFISGNVYIASSNFSMQFGAYDSVRDRTYYGCIIQWYGWSVGFYNRYVKMYGCTISANKMPAISLIYGADTYLSLSSYGEMKDVKCDMVGPRGFEGGGSSASNIIVNSPLDCRHYFNGTDSECQNSEFYYTSGTIYVYNPHFRNCKFTAGTYADASLQYAHFRVVSTYDVNQEVKLFDCEFLDYADNLPRISYGTGFDKSFNIYKSLNIRVCDNDGISIEDASVLLTNRNNDILVNQLTDSSGNMNGGDILTYVKSEGISTDYNPFNLTISKDGYYEYNLEFDFDSKIDTTIALKETEPIVYYQQEIDASICSGSILGNIEINRISGTVSSTEIETEINIEE